MPALMWRSKYSAPVPVAEVVLLEWGNILSMQYLALRLVRCPIIFIHDDSSEIYLKHHGHHGHHGHHALTLVGSDSFGNWRI